MKFTIAEHEYLNIAALPPPPQFSIIVLTLVAIFWDVLAVFAKLRIHYLVLSAL